MTTLLKYAKRFWQDEAGAIGSAELMLLMTLLCIGMIVGMKSFRDAAITEFADMAQGLANLDQTYSFSNGGVSSDFIDAPDFCDEGDEDVGVSGSKCVNVCLPAGAEGSGL